MAGLNALLLGYVMYRSRLVPRVIPVMGLIGAPLFASWRQRVVLGVTEQTRPVTRSASSRSSCGSCRLASG